MSSWVECETTLREFHVCCPRGLGAFANSVTFPWYKKLRLQTYGDVVVL